MFNGSVCYDGAGDNTGLCTAVATTPGLCPGRVISRMVM
jgi:hypothetical protein